MGNSPSLEPYEVYRCDKSPTFQIYSHFEKGKGRASSIAPWKLSRERVGDGLDLEDDAEPHLTSDGMELPPRGLLFSKRMYQPFSSRLVLQGRVHVKDLEINTGLGRKDHIVWSVHLRSSHFGNGIICSLIQRYFKLPKEEFFNRYEMQIAASVAPYPLTERVYKACKKDVNPLIPYDIIPQTDYPFHKSMCIFLEPTEHDAFTFKIEDDGHDITFDLERVNQRGRSRHSLSVTTPFQSSPHGSSFHFGFAAGEAKWEEMFLTHLSLTAYDTHQEYRPTDIVMEDVQDAVLMAVHSKYGARSTLRPLILMDKSNPTSVNALIHILSFLRWSTLKAYHESDGQPINVETAMSGSLPDVPEWNSECGDSPRELEASGTEEVAREEDENVDQTQNITSDGDGGTHDGMPKREEENVENDKNEENLDHNPNMTSDRDHTQNVTTNGDGGTHDGMHDGEQDPLSKSGRQDSEDEFQDLEEVDRNQSMLAKCQSTGYSRVWIRPSQKVPILATHDEFSYDAGALLITIRFVMDRLDKRISVISRTLSSHMDEEYESRFAYHGIEFGIRGGNSYTEEGYDYREIFDMTVTWGDTVMSSQLFGAVALGDTLEYQIYDNGEEYGFKLLHMHNPVDQTTKTEHEDHHHHRHGNASSGGGGDLEAKTVSMKHLDMLFPPAKRNLTLTKTRLREIQPHSSDDDESSVVSGSGSRNSVTPMKCYAYTLRGSYQWATPRFPIMLKHTQIMAAAAENPKASEKKEGESEFDDDEGASWEEKEIPINNLEYENFAVYHLSASGYPF